MEYYVSYHKLIEFFKQIQQNSPRLKTTGHGDIVYFSENITGDTTAVYPYMFITPELITYQESTTEYQFNIIFADIVNTDLSNEIDVISDMSIECKNFIAQIYRGFLFDKIDITLGEVATPFIERFNDHVGGVYCTMTIIVFDDINACVQYVPPPYEVTDPDALLYLQQVSLSGGTTGYTINSSVDNLFISLKNANLYNDVVAFYPFLGNNSNSHSINAKTPTGNTFNLTFYNNWIHTSSGSTGILVGPNQPYANTHIIPNFSWTGAPRDEAYILYYTNSSGYTNDTNVQQFDGSWDGFGLYNWKTSIRQDIGGGTNGMYVTFLDSTESLTAPNDDLYGNYLFFKQSNFDQYIYKNGNQIASGTTTGYAVPTGNYPIYIANFSYDGNITPNTTTSSGRRYAMVMYGKNLTTTNAPILQSIIETFQVSLGRNFN